MNKAKLCIVLCAIAAQVFPTTLSAQWVQTTGPAGGSISSGASSNSAAPAEARIFVANGSQIFVSTNNGDLWSIAHPGTPFRSARVVGAKRDIIFATPNRQLMRSTDNGENWADATDQHVFADIFAFTVNNDGTIFLGTDGTGIFRSDDDGIHWNSTDSGLSDNHISSLLAAPDTARYMYAATRDGVYYSAHHGDFWTKIENLQLSSPSPVLSLLPDVSASGLARVYVGDFAGQLHCSTDGGQTWTTTTQGSASSSIRSLLSASVEGSDTLLLSSSEGMFRSFDSGNTWQPSSTGMQNPDILQLFRSGNRFFALTRIDVYVSADMGATWTEATAGLIYSGSANVSLTVVPAEGNFPETLLAGNDQVGVSASTDFGTRWTHLNEGISRPYVRSVYSCTIATPPNPRFFYAGGADGVYRSEDRGLTWTSMKTGMGFRTVQALQLKTRNDNLGEYLFAGLYGETCFVSPNYGGNWRDLGYTTPISNTMAFAVLGDTLFAGANELMRTVDDGEHWTAVSTAGYGSILSLAVARVQGKSYLITGSLGGGVAVTTDGGSTWQNSNVGLSNKDVFALAVAYENTGTQVFAGTQGGQVFVSTDLCATWRSVSEGLTSPLLSLAISGPYLFAGTRTTGVWRRPLSELTAADDDVPAAPAGITLEQNFPNPFRGGTTITFDIPSRDFVTLRVYNALGREVACMANALLNPGRHVYRWNADGLRSGTYFLTLRTGDRILTKRMTLIE